MFRQVFNYISMELMTGQYSSSKDEESIYYIDGANLKDLKIM